MDKEELSVPGRLVKKDNRLIRTRVNISSVDAARILANLVACIRTADTRLQDYYAISVKDFLGDSSGRGYIRMKALCRDLAQATAEIEGVNELGEFTFKMRPFFIELEYTQGVVTARFNPTLDDFLLNLRACFTQYNLLEYLKLPSIYSQRLFEILKSWSATPEVLIPIADLHRMLDTPASFRSDFWQFRKYVLEKAHKDITEKTSFRYEWEPVKVGRSVEKIRFLFTPRRKALAMKEQEKAKEEKRRRLLNQRFRRAMDCARAKGGDCKTMDNVRIVCKVCREKGICAHWR